MSRVIKTFNPFFVALLVAGTAFAITACGYGVMTVRLLNRTADAGGMVDFFRQHGFTLLMAELGILAICTVLAIMTDDYWTRRAEAKAALKLEQTTAPADENKRENQ
ncbi:hypothetical protein M4951_23270 [Blastopirellula sp. J2-11]|uniref:hypothetical protein n=1 Tax=Blastopirellula sp. J2-11 TaxID=2943192 RepID=UPI0021C838FF|nr:hypothetical protein [Blastopirellula sp. J2-11]UUO06262.1 hypothetical protein M4951_23270 [Blastopirellula sp. J2-11]